MSEPLVHQVVSAYRGVASSDQLQGIHDLVSTFFDPVDLSRLDIEPAKTDLSSYREGLIGVRSRGYERMLTSREQSAVLAYRGHDTSILALQEDMRRGFSEWSHLTIAYSLGKGLDVGPGMGLTAESALVVPSVFLHFPAKGLQRGWNSVPSLSAELVEVLWSLPQADIEGKCVGIYLMEDSLGRPLALGYYGYNFLLNAVNYPRASRGVRRRGA